MLSPATPRAENAAATPVSAIAAQLDQQADKAKLVFDTTSELSPSAYVVDNPARIIVDLPEVAFLIDPTVGHLPNGHKIRRNADRLIKSYRFGLFALGSFANRDRSRAAGENHARRERERRGRVRGS